MENYQVETIDEIECPICESINRITPEMRFKRVRCGGCQVEFPAAELAFDIPAASPPNEPEGGEMNRGWVYVITNKSMPGLVKVGFTTKDPKRRARELDHTGNPHRYTVEYDALVPSPRVLEQAVHLHLASVREGKEWFRCDSETATAAIRECAGGTIIHEEFHAVKKTEVARREEEERTRKLRVEDARRQRKERKHALEPYKQAYARKQEEATREILSKRASIRPSYDQIKESLCGSILSSLVIGAVVALFVAISGHDKDSVVVVGIGVGGLALAVQWWLKTDELTIELRNLQESDRSEIREITSPYRLHSVTCSLCGVTNRVDLDKITDATTDLHCGECRRSLWEYSEN
jgi:hypothetical protein